MAASYPSSIKVFSTKASGDKIRATHIGDLQDEVSAIETALKNGLAHNVLFGTDNTYDIGASGANRPRDFFCARNAAVGGTLGVTGAVTLSSTLAVTGASTLTGAVGITGALTPAALVDISGAGAGQLKFPATQNSSSNANTLDDYEEGSWTPAIGGTTSETGQTYTYQVGRYVKVGKLVTAQGRIQLLNKGTITGNVVIKGLPFTSDNVTNMLYAVQVGYWASMTSGVVAIGGFLSANSSQIGLACATGAATFLASMVSGDLANNTDLVFSITYPAST